MSKEDILKIMQVKDMDPALFNFDTLMIPHMYNYLSQQDIDQLRYIATSARLSSKIKKKYQMIDDIMRARGFRRFAAGTNRIVYCCYEDPRFLVKIAVDKVGMKDNPLEFKNQELLKPFVAKMFYISPCGTVGFAERVTPIRNIAEFKSIASDVFDIIVMKLIGKYVVDDIGTKYFRNWGVRDGFGPVLLDYPYVYNLDGNKLICNNTLDTGTFCGGEIDYDAGFNHLECTNCKRRYIAKDLEDKTKENKIIIKQGGDIMKVTFINSDGKIYGSDISASEVIKKDPEKRTPNRRDLPVVEFSCDDIVYSSFEKYKDEKNVMQVRSTKDEFVKDVDRDEPEIEYLPDNDSHEDQDSKFERMLDPDSENKTGGYQNNSTEDSVENEETSCEVSDEDNFTSREEELSISSGGNESEGEVAEPLDTDSKDICVKSPSNYKPRDKFGRFISKDSESSFEPTPTVKRMTSGKSEDMKKVGNMKKKKNKGTTRIPQ